MVSWFHMCVDGALPACVDWFLASPGVRESCSMMGRKLPRLFFSKEKKLWRKCSTYV